MKNKNLKLVVGIEIGLMVCLCLFGIGGAVYFFGNNATTGTSQQPPSQPVTEAPPLPPPTETPIPILLGTELERLPDGSSKFTDLDGGYEMDLPAGWLAVRPDHTDEVNAALINEGSNNPMLFEQLALDKGAYETNKDRLFFYPLRSDIQKDVLFGFSKLVWQDPDTQAIDNATMGRLVRELEASGALPGLRVTTSVISENQNKVSVMVIKGRFSLPDGQGGAMPFIATLAFFKPTPTSITRITFTFMQDYETQILPDVNLMIESIRLKK